MTNKQNSTSDIEDIRAEHRSLAILRALERTNSCKANNSVLLDWLRRIALVSTRDELNRTLIYLEKNGLVSTATREDLTIVKLTEHGQDVACGRALVEGVLRKGPDCVY